MAHSYQFALPKMLETTMPEKGLSLYRIPLESILGSLHCAMESGIVQFNHVHVIPKFRCGVNVRNPNPWGQFFHHVKLTNLPSYAIRGLGHFMPTRELANALSAFRYNTDENNPNLLPEQITFMLADCIVENVPFISFRDEANHRTVQGDFLQAFIELSHRHAVAKFSPRT